MQISIKATTRHIGDDTFFFLGLARQPGRSGHPVMVRVRNEDGRKSAKAYMIYWSDQDHYLHDCSDEQVAIVASASDEDILATLERGYRFPIVIGSEYDVRACRDSDIRAHFWAAGFSYEAGEEPEVYGYEGGETYEEYLEGIERKRRAYEEEQELRKFICDDFSVELTGDCDDYSKINRLAEAVVDRWSAYRSYYNTTSCFHND